MNICTTGALQRGTSAKAGVKWDVIAEGFCSMGCYITFNAPVSIV